jgi:DNA topoisomerase-1
VQSVAVRLISDREEEIEKIIPEEFWSLTANLQGEGKSPVFPAKLVKEGRSNIKIKNKEQMDGIVAKLKNAAYQVASVVRKEKLRSPAPPFVTSSLQQEAYRKLNFTAKKTMMVAQQLYEGISLSNKAGTTGLITYIRTDSPRNAAEAQQQAAELIKEKYGRDYLPASPRHYATRGKAQNAHEAIRPTDVSRLPDEIKEHLTNDQYKLYRLIWSLFVASQMASAVMDTVTADIKAA